MQGGIDQSKANKFFEDLDENSLNFLTLSIPGLEHSLVAELRREIQRKIEKEQI